MDTWYEWIATFLNLNKTVKFRTEIPAHSGRFLFTDAGCKARIIHNDTKYRDEESRSCDMKANRAERKIFVYPRSRHYVCYDDKYKKVLLKTLKMKPFVLPHFSPFVVAGYK